MQKEKWKRRRNEKGERERGARVTGYNLNIIDRFPDKK
jgi:hypothetical protein